MNRCGLACACLVALLSPAAHAASPDQSRVTVSYLLGFNISAEFKDNTGFPSTAAPGPATGGALNRTYEDGFNHVDISGNAGGKTWNWGYNNAGQLPGNDTVVMSSLAIAPAPAVQDVKDDPHHGFEINYFSPLGEFGPAQFGFEFALGYLSLKLGDTRPLTATTTRTTDAFALDGNLAPLAPFAGSFAGPGPLLGDTPTRTVNTGTATITGRRELDASLYSVRVGPVLELPLSTGLALSVSGGLALLFIDGDFSYAESVIGAPKGPRDASASMALARLGGYLAGGVNWQFARNWSLFGSGQYVSVSNYSITAGDRTARLNLGGSVFVSAGLGFSF